MCVLLCYVSWYFVRKVKQCASPKVHSLLLYVFQWRIKSSSAAPWNRTMTQNLDHQSKTGREDQRTADRQTEERNSIGLSGRQTNTRDVFAAFISAKDWITSTARECRTLLRPVTKTVKNARSSIWKPCSWELLVLTIQSVQTAIEHVRRWSGFLRWKCLALRNAQSGCLPFLLPANRSPLQLLPPPHTHTHSNTHFADKKRRLQSVAIVTWQKQNTATVHRICWIWVWVHVCCIRADTVSHYYNNWASTCQCSNSSVSHHRGRRRADSSLVEPKAQDPRK